MMFSQQVHPEEFFIYVPLSHIGKSLSTESDSLEESELNQSAHEDWTRIPLAERVVVYTHVCGEEEKIPLLS